MKKSPSKSSLTVLTPDKFEHSPSTPELASVFCGDSKFLANLSDSDKKRHQELCTRRASSIDSPLGIKNLPRDRSASSLLLSSHQMGGIVCYKIILIKLNLNNKF